MFKYTRAVCRKIPRSIVSEGLRLEEPENPLDFSLATKQLESYVQALREAGIEDITLLEADERVPDCVFVEDTAVVIGDTALITNPGAEARRAEVEVIHEHFKKEPDMQVIAMQGDAHADGGDVLFTGREIFVGLSTRTNKDGVESIREAFPAFPVHAIRVGDGTLHLKSLMSMAGHSTIVFGESCNAIAAKELVLSTATVHYDTITVPDDSAANCLFINGVLVHRSAEEFPACADVFGVSVQVKKMVGLNMSELEKVDGALTCCSLLY